ncbi:testis expressed sequence 13A-like protein [Camelus ferus]|nr:testis expressed sequence 13A-like protein [Camelus ferus]
MAVDLRDPRSGFRHNEVVMFINEEEQVGERETATWALASQLQRLREEREEVAKQLHCTRNDLQQALTEREELRGQLLQAERQPQEVVPRSRAQHLGAEAWPLTTEERNKLLVATSQRRQLEEVQREAQNVSTGGLLYMPGPPTPWSQVAQPPLPMPFPYPPPPPPTVVSEVETAAAAAAAATAAAFPPQMPAGGTYPPGMWPAVVSQEEVALQRDPRIQGQQEGPVRPYFINPPGHSWSQEDPTKRQPQEQMPRPLEGKKAFKP